MTKSLLKCAFLGGMIDQVVVS